MKNTWGIFFPNHMRNTWGSIWLKETSRYPIHFLQQQWIFRYRIEGLWNPCCPIFYNFSIAAQAFAHHVTLLSPRLSYASRYQCCRVFIEPYMWYRTVTWCNIERNIENASWFESLPVPPYSWMWMCHSWFPSFPPSLPASLPPSLCFPSSAWLPPLKLCLLHRHSSSSSYLFWPDSVCISM